MSMKPFNQNTPRLELIAGYEYEKRAIEIALIGNHPIVFLINKGSEIPSLLMTANRIALEQQIRFKGLVYFWCPCGNYGSLKDECQCKYPVIERHLRKLAKVVSKYDIWSQSQSYPRQYHLGEVEEEFVGRVKRAIKFREEQVSDNAIRFNSSSPLKLLTDSSVGLLKDYQQKVSIRVDVPKVVQLAITIALADYVYDFNYALCRPLIHQHHLATALQYQPYTMAGMQGILNER